jgi:hypothetical protein
MNIEDARIGMKVKSSSTWTTKSGHGETYKGMITKTDNNESIITIVITYIDKPHYSNIVGGTTRFHSSYLEPEIEVEERE